MRLYTFRYAPFPILLRLFHEWNRDSLHVRSIESDWTVPLAFPPPPIYKDVNITVYGLPILPVTSSNSSVSGDPFFASEQLESSSKRKRSPSPDSSHKKQALAPEAENSTSLAEETPELASDSASTKDPQEWRKLMISHMFPGTPGEIEVEERPKGRDCPKKKKQKTGRKLLFTPFGCTRKTTLPPSQAYLFWSQAFTTPSRDPSGLGLTREGSYSRLLLLQVIDSPFVACDVQKEPRYPSPGFL